MMSIRNLRLDIDQVFVITIRSKKERNQYGIITHDCYTVDVLMEVFKPTRVSPVQLLDRGTEEVQNHK